MAIYKNTPPIITNGLVLYLDAGNRISYTSGSTTWTDLSGNGNSGSLTNGPTFTTQDLGSISTDGTNDFIAIASNPIWDFGTSSFSISVWYKPGTGTLTNLIRHDTALAQGLWWIRTSTATVDFIAFNASRVSAINFSASVSNTTTEWHYVTAVRRYNSQSQIYFDGRLCATNTTTETENIIAGSGAYPAIGRAGSFNGEYSTYAVGAVQIYNRGLSDQEILQNYNATKTRFGLT